MPIGKTSQLPRRQFEGGAIESARMERTTRRALEQMDRREKRLHRGNMMRYVGGSAIVAAVLFVAPSLIWKVATLLSIDPDVIRGSIGFTRAMLLDGLMLLFTIPVAFATRKESRADTVENFLDAGLRHDGASTNPLVRLALVIAMLGLLQGEFVLIDSLKTTFLRLRLRCVDRRRAAEILGMLFSNPAGIDPRQLLRPGEIPSELRRTIAYLMLFEWGDISRKGDHLMLLSPAKRALRH